MITFSQASTSALAAEAAAHARGDRIEEALHQHHAAGGEQGRGAELLVVDRLDGVDLVAVALQRKRHRHGQRQPVLG
jgi:hypothetical protein